MNQFFGFGEGGPPNQGNYGGFGGGGGGQVAGPTHYQNIFRAYPSSVFGRSDIDKGNKILLPANVLYELCKILCLSKKPISTYHSL